jgi:hypothetical protein
MSQELVGRISGRSSERVAEICTTSVTDAWQTGTAIPDTDSRPEGGTGPGASLETNAE